MTTVVQKYGGTSVDGHEKLRAIAERVAVLRADGHDVVVVVSAPGRTTDSLVADAGALCDEPCQRELDMLMTAGERISMSLLAIALNAIGCPAVSFTGSQVGIITDTRHTDARILEVRPHRLVKELEAGNVVVVGGFQGVSTAKDVTTLGRGGSDTTAVALAAALGAERCEIHTDVDGVYTGDPNRVTDARRIDEISYDDMGELARFGATVLKEEAVRFAERNSIVLDVRRSLSDAPGTIVLAEPSVPPAPVTGLSLLEDVELVSWELSPEVGLLPPAELPPGAVKFLVTHGRTVVAAVDRCVRSTLDDAGISPASAAAADLVCVVGSEAGSPETVASIGGALADLGVEPLAVVSGGRSTVVALRTDRSGELLEKLHEVFFSHASGGPTRSPLR